MSKFQKLNVLNLATILGMIVFGFSLKNSLPEIIPTKFSAEGVVLKSAPIIPSIFFLPMVATFAVLILTFLVRTDKNFWSKESNKEAVAQTNLGILLLIASLYVGTFLNALNYAVFFKYSYFAIGFGLFFILSAIPMKNMDKNLFYGIRVPWTLSSELNWKKTHEFTSKLMLIGGVLLFVIGFLTRNHSLILSLMGITLIAPMIYSYRLKKVV